MSSARIKNRISDNYVSPPFHSNSNLMMGCSSSQSGSLPAGGNAAAGGCEQLTDNNSKATDSEASSADKYPPAEAFEISLDDVEDNGSDDKNDSLIKRHPPKRLQKLVEQAATAVPATTIEHLEEKLAKAEVRRQQYIQQRIENIITLTSKGGNAGASDGDDGGNDDQNDGLKDDEAAVIVSSSTNSISSSSKDADVVVPPTKATSSNEDVLSLHK